LQVYVSNVSAISNVRCNCFCLDVAYVACHTHMLQTYVVNVSSVSDVFAANVFMLQVFHEQACQGAQAKVVPLGATVPACAGEMKRARHRREPQSCIHGHDSRRGARSFIMGKQQVRSTRRNGARSCIISALRVSLLKIGRQQARMSGRPGTSLSEMASGVEGEFAHFWGSRRKSIP
jgi:hypothetical protein